jgi:hypothetical protein
MAEGRGVSNVLLRKPEGKRPLGRPRCRCEENINMEFQELGCGCMDWIEVDENRDKWRALEYVLMNLWVS